MNHNQNSTNLFILICLSLIVLDLILKSVVSSNIPQGEYQPILGGLLTIGSVKTVNNVYGSVLSTQIWPIIKIFLQALFVFMFLRMQRLDIHSLYKYASTMMVFGWLGNYIDKFVLFGEDSS